MRFLISSILTEKDIAKNESKSFKYKFYINNDLSALIPLEETEKVIHLKFKINRLKNCKITYILIL